MKTFSSACTQQPPVWAWSHRPVIVSVPKVVISNKSKQSYIVLVGLLVLVTVLAEIIVVLVKVLLVLVEVVLLHLLKSKGLARKPVDGTRDELLLDVLTKLVVKLEALFDVTGSIVVVLRRRLGRGEEVEEGLGGDGLLDNASLLGV